MIDELIKAALLGTEKYTPAYDLADEALPQKISAQGEDREDVFLKQCAAAFLYAEAGTKAVARDFPDLRFRGETGAFVSGKMHEMFRQAVQDGDFELLRYVTHFALAAGLYAAPALAPALLDIAVKQGKNGADFAAVCGPVGQWLCAFNPEWARLYVPEAEEDFDTASLEGRKKYLTRLREKDPAQARALLQDNIKQESADKRAELLQTLQTGLSAADEPFLDEQLSTDKSKKVKEVAARLLTLMPGSRISNLYLEYWKTAVRIEEKRQLLSVKRKCVFSETALPAPELFQIGMENVSVEKNFPDHLFHIAQTIAALAPDTMATALSTDAGTLLDLLIKSDEGKRLFPWLGSCAQTFRHQAWARRLLEEKIDIELIDVLDPQERNGYYKKMPLHELRRVADRLFDESYTAIPKDMAEFILATLRAQPYSMDAPLYYRLGFYLPGSMLPLLNKHPLDETETGEQHLRYFSQNIRNTIRALEYKLQIRPD